jgi:hypothetical protein
MGPSPDQPGHRQQHRTRSCDDHGDSYCHPNAYPTLSRDSNRLPGWSNFTTNAQPYGDCCADRREHGDSGFSAASATAHTHAAAASAHR